MFPAEYLHAQDARARLDSLYDELTLLLSDDSVALKGLLDLDSLPADPQFSSLSFRTGYVSQVVNSGRDLGLDHFGLSAGATYFHPKGFTADLSGFYSSDYDPAYYMTAFNVGYWKTLASHWTFSVGHDFYFYQGHHDEAFNKSALASTTWSGKFLDASVDYRFLYGTEQAHRLIGSLRGNIRFRELGPVDRLSIQPFVSIYFGNAGVIYFRQSETPVLDLYQLIRHHEEYPRLSPRQVRRLYQLLSDDRPLAAGLYLRNHGYSDAQITELSGTYSTSTLVENNEFGLMNYAAGISLSVSAQRWNAFLNYSYNIPVALPGETYEYARTGYFSLALSYTLIWF